MENEDKLYPGPDEKNPLTDKKIKDDDNLGTGQGEDLVFNEEADSFELDVESDDPDYNHPDPYESKAPNGEDDNSDWDEANLYVGDEYDKNASLETDVEKLGMHIDNGEIVEVDPVDEILAKTPEDDRNDLDEEGYLKNDEDIFK